MSESQLASHTPSHQFVKSGNLFGNEATDLSFSVQIAGVQYDGVRYGAGGADHNGVLHIATEHGALQVQIAQGAQGFPGDYRFVLEIQGNVNEFLSDERLDLIERFELTVQHGGGGVSHQQFAVNLIDVVYSGEHFLSDALSAQDVLPPSLTADESDLALRAGDLLIETAVANELNLDQYLGVEARQGVVAAEDFSASHYGHGLETTKLDILPDSGPATADG